MPDVQTMTAQPTASPPVLRPIQAFARFLLSSARSLCDADHSPTLATPILNFREYTRAEAASIYCDLFDIRSVDVFPYEYLEPLSIAAAQAGDFGEELRSFSAGQRPLTDAREFWYDRTAVLGLLIVPGMILANHPLQAARLVELWYSKSITNRELFFDEPSAAEMLETSLFALPLWSLATFLPSEKPPISGPVRNAIHRVIARTFPFVPAEVWCYHLIAGGILVHLQIRDQTLLDRAAAAANYAEGTGWEYLHQRILQFQRGSSTP